MHDVIATQGIVLGKRSLGEANIAASLFTEELGVIRTSARSARLERSKLRYGLEPLTQGRFSLVRGKYDWKVTGTQQLSRPFAAVSLAQRKTAGRISRLLLRLIHGEEPVPELYTTVASGLAYLSGEIEESEIEHIEGILVLRILSHLGYVEQGKGISVFLEDSNFSSGLAAQAKAARPALIRAINASLAETGL